MKPSVPKCSQRFAEFINLVGIPRIIMQSRKITKIYFDLKYKKRDPYGIYKHAYDTRYKDMLTLIGPRRFHRALDIGCGEGMFSAMLLDRCNYVEGIDISKSAIVRARKEFRGISALSFFHSDALKLNSFNKYDLLVLAEFLYYLNKHQLKKFIDELAHGVASDTYLLVGNIKRISSNSGLLRSHLTATEIMDYLLDAKRFEVITEVDRGNDILYFLKAL